MNQSLSSRILGSLRDVPNFPKPGIIFKDITPLLADPSLMQEAVTQLALAIEPYSPNCIAGIEARGFIFGATLAAKMNLPFVPIRKPGKLPWKTKQLSYELEYGTNTLEIHEDAFELETNVQARVAVIDDLLATGGTTKATCNLIRAVGASAVVCGFAIELAFLGGRKVLEPEYPCLAVATVH